MFPEAPSLRCKQMPSNVRMNETYMTLGLEVVGFERITLGSSSSGLPSSTHSMNVGCVGIAQHTWASSCNALVVHTESSGLKAYPEGLAASST